MLEGKANFRINCRNASAGLTEFEQLCFRHKPLHVRERYLYRVRLETCVVWAPWREWSSILLVGNLQYTTLGFTRHTKERDTGGKRTRLFCLFLIIHAREGCSLSFVSVSWHMYRYDGAGCVHICVTLCVFCNCRDVPVKCMNISLSVCLCVSYVHMGDTEPVQPHWKQQLFSTVQIKVRKEAQWWAQQFELMGSLNPPQTTAALWRPCPTL